MTYNYNGHYGKLSVSKIIDLKKKIDLRGAVEEREDKNTKQSVEGFFDWYALAPERRKKNLTTTQTWNLLALHVSLSPPSFISTTHLNFSCSFP